MSLPPKLEAELAELRALFDIIVVEDAHFIELVFQEFPLEAGYSHARTQLLLRVPRVYPEAGPDMFWVEPQITLASGQIPQAAESVETYQGRQWRRFSWHRQAPWNPTYDNLHTHMEFILRRLRERR